MYAVVPAFEPIDYCLDFIERISASKCTSTGISLTERKASTLAPQILITRNFTRENDTESHNWGRTQLAIPPSWTRGSPGSNSKLQGRRLGFLHPHGISPSCWSWARQSCVLQSTGEQGGAWQHSLRRVRGSRNCFFHFSSYFFLPTITQNMGTNLTSVHAPAAVERGEASVSPLGAVTSCGPNVHLWY